MPVLLGQALNDFVDTLADISVGRGRAVLRSSRSLFEHLVAAHDVLSNPALEQRYADHRYVIEQIEARLETEYRELKGKEKVADAHHRRKLGRDGRPAFDTAIRTYGPGFRRSWADKDLASRARGHGLGDDYDFFRLGSAVLHGSSGGALGIRKEIGNKIVHRQGPALQLCPLALLQALRFFDMLVSVYERTQGRSRIATELRESIRNARRVWPAYRRAVRKLDKAFWPEIPPSDLIAVAVFDALTQIRRWYLHEPNSGRLREAYPPAFIEPEQDRQLQSVEQFHYDNHLGSPELVSVAMVDVHVDPKPNSPWRDAREVMPHATPFGWQHPTL